MEDIADTEDKHSKNKHNKYIDFYKYLKNASNKDNEYWGIGIENESYLMFEKLQEVDKKFLLSNHMRERYSVDYWINYKKNELDKTLELLPEKINLPIYINGYLFQKTDLFGEPTKQYTKLSEPNPNFSGKTIDEHLKEKSNIITNKEFSYFTVIKYIPI